jgi:hypothetical protein
VERPAGTFRHPHKSNIKKQRAKSQSKAQKGTAVAEIRNSNIETRNKFEIRMTETLSQSEAAGFGLEISVIQVCFEFRASYFVLWPHRRSSAFIGGFQQAGAFCILICHLDPESSSGQAFAF